MTGRTDNDALLPDEILVACAQENPDEFARLYERYAQQIHGFVLGRTHDHDLASDITSQVFVRAFSALPNYRTGPFRAWLYAIARNLLVDNYRRRKPTVEIADSVEERSGAHAPEEQAIAAESRAVLHAALDVLTSSQRQIVLLRLRGLSGHEIAVELRMSYAAMKSAQYRAFGRLRNHLGTHPDHEAGPDRHGETR